MASLTVISGVGGKLPAAFLLEIEGYRLLWDLGAGPEHLQQESGRQFSADAADHRQACHGRTPCGRRRVSREASSIKPSTIPIIRHV